MCQFQRHTAIFLAGFVMRKVSGSQHHASLAAPSGVPSRPVTGCQPHISLWTNNSYKSLWVISVHFSPFKVADGQFPVPLSYRFGRRHCASIHRVTSSIRGPLSPSRASQTVQSLGTWSLAPYSSTTFCMLVFDVLGFFYPGLQYLLFVCLI